MADAGDRTEKATSRHRKQARDKGQFAYSQELTSVMILTACMTTVAYYIESPGGFQKLLCEPAAAGRYRRRFRTHPSDRHLLSNRWPRQSSLPL